MVINVGRAKELILYPAFFASVNGLMNRHQMFIYPVIILLAVFSRLLPHPPNFTPVSALALFAAAAFVNPIAGFLAVVAALIISDAFLGFHSSMPAVYLSFALTFLIGFWLRGKTSPFRLTVSSLASSILFFVVTNASVWWFSGYYSHNSTGLAATYIAAIPFFRNTLFGDLVYSYLLFGTAWLALRQSKSLPAHWKAY